MPAKKKPKGEARPQELVFVRLKVPTNGIVAGRVVTASSKKAKQLKDDDHAEDATQRMIGLAGGSIPHIQD